jgi:ribosome-binding protein aMBF1 (putative translation factor)
MKTIKASELLDQRYGARGSDEREKFREEAFSYYFGEIIKNRRKELKLSQEQLAQKLGKQRPYISRIENGEDIRLSNFAAVADALDLSIQVSAK